MRPTVTAIAVLALAGQPSVLGSSPPIAPGIRDTTSQPPPSGPGRKGADGRRTGTGSAGPDAAATRPDPRARDAQAAWMRDHPGAAYRTADDPAHALVFATCLDERSHADMQRMLAAQADQQAATLFEAPPGTEVFVAVATPADIAKEFAGSPTTAGMYEHPKRRIVTADIGSALRHEWTHAMHFGHMERLGQPHAMWVQEGIAALYETYEESPDGSIRFLPNERHNLARTAAADRGSMHLAQLVALGPDDFMRRSATLYPVVRSVFEYMADRGLLRAWYRRYVDTFAEDRSGRRAIEDTFGESIESFERAWRAWTVARPAVDLSAGPGDARVGVTVRAAVDGVEVTRVDRGSAAQRAGIRAGDVILAVGGAPVRSPREWTQATAAIRAPEITLAIRRAGSRSEVVLVFDRQSRAPGGRTWLAAAFPVPVRFGPVPATGCSTPPRTERKVQPCT